MILRQPFCMTERFIFAPEKGGCQVILDYLAFIMKKFI